MRRKEKDVVAALVGDEPVHMSAEVRFEIEVGAGLKPARLYTTQSRLFLCRATPMGFQVAVVWYQDVERVAWGKKKGDPYVQLLGESSRILVVFEAKSVRNEYRRKCLEIVKP